jgi:hypothetical protein
MTKTDQGYLYMTENNQSFNILQYLGFAIAIEIIS